jgi:hypothetical protein
MSAKLLLWDKATIALITVNMSWELVDIGT